MKKSVPWSGKIDEDIYKKMKQYSEKTGISQTRLVEQGILMRLAAASLGEKNESDRDYYYQR